MNLHENISDNLIQYLKDIGYPNESIASEFSFGNYRADLVIVDPKSRIPLTIFEVKSGKDDRFLKAGLRQLSELNVRMTIKVPMYLVFPKQNSPFFEIFQFNPQL